MLRTAGAVACLTVSVLAAAAHAGAAGSQGSARISGEKQENAVRIPVFGDPRLRMERPDLSGAGTIRFLSDDSFPPLTFLDGGKHPAGFVVELARDACDRLAARCTIQSRRFDLLLEALASGQGDVVAAAVPVTPRLLERFSVTRRYMRFPGRFAVKAGAELPQPGEAGFAGRTVGVVAGSAHEAWMKAFFPGSPLKAYPDLASAGAALKAGEVPYLFGDGLSLSLWLNGARSQDCCRFTGGPYFSDAYFGEGVGFIVRRDDETLLRALDYALQQAWADGKFEELYLRYFPVSFF